MSHHIQQVSVPEKHHHRIGANESHVAILPWLLWDRCSDELDAMISSELA